MSDIKLGLQLYSVRNSYGTDLPGTLAKVKQMGYDCVEFFWVLPCRATELKKMLDDNGLTVCGWHTGFDKLEGDALYAMMDYQDIIGNHLVGLNAGPDMLDTPEKVEQFRERMLSIQQRLEGTGFNLEYHNHWWEFEGEMGSRNYDKLMDGNNLLAQFDVGNAKNGGIDAMDYLKRHAGRHIAMHIKPFSLTTGFESCIGSDSIDWQPIFEHCRNNGTKYYIVEFEGQDETKQLERAKENLCGLKKLLNK